ncbi:MAG: sigma-70 family RNA polymerase sigma factor [Verrucomicrobia bacterium]|nr:sigma-70 family RNA polymerase sigma factor [Verrucomicrobiota bacterium]
MKKERSDLADSFMALLRPIRRELEVYSRRLVWNQQDAPDAIQNAVLNAFKAFDRYHDDTNFRAWMFTILTHEISKLNKKFARLARSEFQVEPETLDALPALEQCAEFTDWLNSPEALADALDQQLLAALKTLTETERAVLLLRAVGEFRYREIAESLGIPMGSVMGHLARARKKMQDALLRSQRRSVL